MTTLTTIDGQPSRNGRTPIRQRVERPAYVTSTMREVTPEHVTVRADRLAWPTLEFATGPGLFAGLVNISAPSGIGRNGFPALRAVLVRALAELDAAEHRVRTRTRNRLLAEALATVNARHAAPPVPAPADDGVGATVTAE